MNTLNLRFNMSLEVISDETYTTVVNLISTEVRTFNKTSDYNRFLNGIRKIFELNMKELTE